MSPTQSPIENGILPRDGCAPAETRPRRTASQAQIIAAWSAEADAMSATDFHRTSNRLERLREAAARLIDGCDFLLLPTVPFVAFPAEQPGYGPDALFAPWVNTFLFNLTGQPASSLPCAVSAEGLPIGLQIVGRRHADASVLALSAAFEALRPMHGELKGVISRQGR